MSADLANHFHTLGYLHLKHVFAPDEMAELSRAFDRAMRVARGPEADDPPTTRQDIIPFFDYDPETFYPLLDDPRICDVFETLLGPDFILSAMAGVVHAGGIPWHHDSTYGNSIAPEGAFTMRAAIYLDALTPEEGCLNVIPGSHHTAFREALAANIGGVGVEASGLPGRVALVNEPGDVLFLNHKLFHAVHSDRPGRRAIHITCFPNATESSQPEYFRWMVGYLDHITQHWGRIYSKRLVETATPRRERMLARAIELGFGTTGPITRFQDR